MKSFPLPRGAILSACVLLLFVVSVEAKITSSIANGAWLQSATWNNGIPVSGDNVNISNSVILNTNGEVLANLDLLPGALLSSSSGLTLTINGSSLWTGGTLFAGLLVQEGTLTFNGATNTIQITGEATLSNVFTIFHSGTANLGMAGNLYNAPNATYSFQNDVGISNVSVANTQTFENQGLLSKSGGSGNSLVSIANFENLGGTINAQSGQITLDPPDVAILSNGTYSAQSGGVLDLAALFACYGTLSGSGTGQVQINGGIEVFASSPCSFNFSTNLLQWIDGGFLLGTNLSNLGSLTISGTNRSRSVSGPGTFINLGQVVETGAGCFAIEDSGLFDNASGGLFEFQDDCSISNSSSTSGTGAFTNNGLIRKIGGSGTSSVVVASFVNTATVEALSGTLAFSTFTQTAGTTLINGGVLGPVSSMFGPGYIVFNIQGGSLTGSGLITGNVTSGGVVAPGLPVGAIQITGNYTQTAGGALAIALAGRNSGQFDQLNVNGSATLSGALNVSLLPGFGPVAGDSYQIVSCSSHSGTFNTISGLPPGMLVNYAANGVFLDVSTNFPPILIQPALSGTNFTFSFQSAGGVSYTVQVNTNLATTNWTSLQAIVGDGSLETVVEPVPGVPQQFFRVMQP